MSSTPTLVKRTYASRGRQNRPVIPSPSPLLHPATKRKRPLEEQLYSKNIPVISHKRAKTAKYLASEKPNEKTFTQLHFCLDQSVIRTCPFCKLSYTKGAPDDETLHRTHCARVRRGMEWGREEEKEGFKAGVVELASGVLLKNGKKGRIICFPANAGGKINSKVNTLIHTINLALSAPSLTSEAVKASKIYLFLLAQESKSSRENIAGCAVVQRISSAMAIASSSMACNLSDSKPSTGPLVAVDTDAGLFCHPEHLPTPMGIPRIFVPAAHRRQGIASVLLSIAARTFIHGCPLDPRKGQVAFTQPTGDGSALMSQWGGGGVRIYEE